MTQICVYVDIWFVCCTWHHRVVGQSQAAQIGWIRYVADLDLAQSHSLPFFSSSSSIANLFSIYKIRCEFQKQEL